MRCRCEKVVLLWMFSLVLVSCGVSGENGNSNGNDQGESEVESLSFEVEHTAKDDVGVFTMNLSNDSEKPVQLTFSSGQQYEIVVKDSDGDKVYMFSEDRMFTEAIIEEEIAAGDVLSFEQEWDYTSGGKRVDSNEYEATVSLTAQTVNGEKVVPMLLCKSSLSPYLSHLKRMHQKRKKMNQRIIKRRMYLNQQNRIELNMKIFETSSFKVNKENIQ